MFEGVTAKQWLEAFLVGLILFICAYCLTYLWFSL